MAMAMLPILSVGGMQLFRTEAFDTPDKVLPRAAQIAGGIFAIYLFMTGLCALALWTTVFWFRRDSPCYDNDSHRRIFNERRIDRVLR